MSDAGFTTIDVDGARARVPVADASDAVLAIQAFTQFQLAEAPAPATPAEAAAALAARKTKRPFYTATKVDSTTFKIVLTDEATGQQAASGLVSTNDADADDDDGDGDAGDDHSPHVAASAGAMDKPTGGEASTVRARGDASTGADAAPAKLAEPEPIDSVPNPNQEDVAAPSESNNTAPTAASAKPTDADKNEALPATAVAAQEGAKAKAKAKAEDKAELPSGADGQETVATAAARTYATDDAKADPSHPAQEVAENTGRAGVGAEKEAKDVPEAKVAPASAAAAAAAADKEIPKGKAGSAAATNGTTATAAPAPATAGANAKKEAVKPTPKATPREQEKPKKEKRGFFGRKKKSSSMGAGKGKGKGKGTEKGAGKGAQHRPVDDPIPQGPRNAVFIPETRYQPNPLAPSRVAERERMPITPLSAEEKALRAQQKQADKQARADQLKKDAEQRAQVKKAKEAEAEAKAKVTETKAETETAPATGTATEALAADRETSQSKPPPPPVQAQREDPAGAKAATAAKDTPKAVANANADADADVRSDDTWSSRFEPEVESWDQAAPPFAAPVGAVGHFTAVKTGTDAAELAAPEHEHEPEPDPAAEAALFAPAVAPTGAPLAAVDDTRAAAAAAAAAQQTAPSPVAGSGAAAAASRTSLDSAREVESLAAGATAAGSRAPDQGSLAAVPAAATSQASKGETKVSKTAPAPGQKIVQPSEAEQAREEGGRFSWFRRTKPSPKEPKESKDARDAAGASREEAEAVGDGKKTVAMPEDRVTSGEQDAQAGGETSASASASASDDEAAGKTGVARHSGADALAEGVKTEPESDVEPAVAAPVNTSRLRENLSSGGTDGVTEEDSAALRADKTASKRLTGLRKQTDAEEKAREREDKKWAALAAKTTSGQRSALEGEGEAARTHAASEAKRLEDLRKAAAKTAAREQKAKVAAEKKARLEASRAAKARRKQAEGAAAVTARKELAAWQERQATLARERLAAVKAQRAVLDEAFTPERAAEAATNPAEQYDVWRHEHPLDLKRQGDRTATTVAAPHVRHDGERAKHTARARSTRSAPRKVNPGAPLSRKYGPKSHVSGADGASAISTADVPPASAAPAPTSLRSEITVVNPSRGRGIPVPAIQWTNGGSW